MFSWKLGTQVQSSGETERWEAVCSSGWIYERVSPRGWVEREGGRLSKTDSKKRNQKGNSVRGMGED